jgi:MoaA/NifB/PqqE/SkfB family radical SAM enzyme
VTPRDAVVISETVTGEAVRPLDFLWLEVTGKCQLACSHCYASSGRVAAMA